MRPAPLRRLGRLELLAGGAAFIAPAFSLAAGYPVLAVSGGSVAPLGILVGTLAALLAAVCFAQMARVLPREGGAYAFVESTAGRTWGFVAGWSLSLLYVLGPAIPLAVLMASLEVFFPSWLAASLGTATAISGAVFLVNASGARPSSRVALSFFLLEASLLALVALLLAVRPGVPLPPPPGPTGTLFMVGGSAAAAVFLFLGFDSVSTYGEEATRPTHQVPWATLSAILVAAALYVGSSLSYLHAIPLSSWSLGNASFPQVLGETLGPGGSQLIALVVMVSSLGALIAVENASARALFAMSRDGLLPHPLARLRGRGQVPMAALLVPVLASWGLVAWSQVTNGPLAPPANLLFGIVFGLVVLGALLAYLLVAWSYFRWLRRNSARGGGWTLGVPLGAMAVAGILLGLQVLSTWTGSPDLPAALALWFAVGFALWGVTVWAGRHRPSRPSSMRGPARGDAAPRESSVEV